MADAFDKHFGTLRPIVELFVRHHAGARFRARVAVGH
jgi:hypothetical protein